MAALHSHDEIILHNLREPQTALRRIDFGKQLGSDDSSALRFWEQLALWQVRGKMESRKNDEASTSSQKRPRSTEACSTASSKLDLLWLQAVLHLHSSTSRIM